MSEPNPKDAMTICAMALGILREDNESAWTPLSLNTRTLALIDVLYAMQECDECGRPMHNHDGYTGDNREIYVCNADPEAARPAFELHDGVGICVEHCLLYDGNRPGKSRARCHIRGRTTVQGAPCHVWVHDLVKKERP